MSSELETNIVAVEKVKEYEETEKEVRAAVCMKHEGKKKTTDRHYANTTVFICFFFYYYCVITVL